MLRKYFIPILIALSLSLPITSSQAEDEPTGIELHSPIPSFAANTHEGNLWTPDDLPESNEYLVVYFYPAAMTSGCTKQACSYRDNADAIAEENITVIGVSGDSVNNLKNFKEEHELNFTLLSDVNGVIAEKFGVPQKGGGEITRTFGGKEVLMRRSYTSARWTYVFDSEGKLIYRNQMVNAAEDSDIVLSFIRKHKLNNQSAD